MSPSKQDDSTIEYSIDFVNILAFNSSLFSLSDTSIEVGAPLHGPNTMMNSTTGNITRVDIINPEELKGSRTAELIEGIPQL